MRFRLLIFFLFFLGSSFQQETVLICKSETAYAYHRFYCRGLKECRHGVEKITMREAISLRRTPCGYCYEKGAGDSSVPGDTQCKGITKSGKRCSRKAGAGGYCWQHG